MATHNKDQLTLPDRLISSVDLARLIRELEALDESLRQTALRKAGEPTNLARSSQTLEELARLNGLQISDETQRQQMIGLLTALLEHAPRIRMGLATEPTATFTKKITTWLRTNVNPLILLEIGLQPSIAAGCTIRTNNKIFDMSLRNHFVEQRGLLVQKIAEIGQKADDEVIAAAMQEQKAVA